MLSTMQAASAHAHDRRPDNETSGPLLQEPACVRCRQQKLKCSKDKPSCKRCMNLSKPCVYPPPPDRKRLVAQRRRHLASDRSPPAPTIPSGPSPEVIQRRLSEPSSLNQFDLPPPSSHRSAKDDLFPSSEIAMFLIEVYFSRAYNASLLYHKQRFINSWIGGSLPAYLALSVFATASVFLKNNRTSGPPALADSTYDWRRCGEEWANRASQEALAQSDIPNIETVQACQTLALYWLALGQTRRVHFHVGVAYRVCRLLGIHLETNATDDPVTAELRRRCLWACWITQCISQENASFKASCWDDIAGLPLPSDESSYKMSGPQPTHSLTSNGEIKPLPDCNTERCKEGSPMSELAELCGIWWSIHHFMKRLSIASASDLGTLLVSWMELSARLEKVGDSLPAMYYQKPPVSSDPDVGIEKIFSLLCLRHASACVLNVAIVPLYSRPSKLLNAPKVVIKAAAQEALDHASITLNIANDLCAYGPEPSKISALTGYCLYLCIYVQQKYFLIQPEARHTSVSPSGAVSILTTLQDYWQSLGVFVALLQEQTEQTQNQAVDNPLQGKDFDTPSTNVYPDIENYVNDEIKSPDKSTDESPTNMQRGEFDHQGRPRQSTGISRQSSALAESAPTRIERSAEGVASRDGASQVFSARGDNPSHFVDAELWHWWDIDQATNDPNSFSIFDLSGMDGTY